MEIINVSNVTKRFKEKIVLDNISFEVCEGEIFGLIGPNGAGKSTLLNMMTGILSSSSGNIKICDYDIEKQMLKAKGCIGYVMQDLALIENLSAKDNLEYFGALYGLSGKVLKERINEALEIAGLSDSGKKRVDKFSGGMKRRLNLACAIMHHPKILILDEPTVGVDVQSRNHIFNFIKNVGKKWGTTVLYTSHYMEEVEELCDRVFIIDKGKEVASGSKKDIQNKYSNNKIIEFEIDRENLDITKLRNIDSIISSKINGNKITINAGNNFSLLNVISILENDKVKIQKVNYIEEKLEDIFIKLTGSRLRD
ncbi:MAG: ATP-binding cassette domain-containing protein [Sarcina sp.]